MLKKIIITLIIILVIAIIGITAYIYISKKEPSEIPIISALFPKSENIDSINKEIREDGEKIIKTEKKDEKIILTVYDKPVSSAIAAGYKIRYIDKLNGHLYEADLNGENANKISNTTILNVFDVIWGKNGESAVFKFLNNNNNSTNYYAAEFKNGNAAGSFLPNNSLSAALSNENKLSFIANEGGRGLIYISSIGLNDKKQALNLPVADFNILWEGNDNLLVFTKPSAFSDGILYSYNLKNKIFKKIKEEKGITVLPSETGDRILISYSSDKTSNILVLDKKREKEYILTAKTLSEKCVWSKTQENVIFCALPLNLQNGDYPDDWYAGKISFNDVVYKINYLTGENKILSKDLNEEFDAVSLSLDENENYLFFVNKKNDMLLRLKIE